MVGLLKDSFLEIDLFRPEATVIDFGGSSGILLCSFVDIDVIFSRYYCVRTLTVPIYRVHE